MFDIDDVLTLTALLPVVTMDTHTRTQTNTHTHMQGSCSNNLQDAALHSCALCGRQCIQWAQLFWSTQAESRRGGERERGVFDKSMSNRRSSWAVQWQSTIGISLCGLRACTLL